MKTPPNIVRDTVKSLADSGHEFYLVIPITGQPAGSAIRTAPIKISAIQLSKAVTWANRTDEVIADCKKGRNGRKSALIIEIPYK